MTAEQAIPIKLDRVSVPEDQTGESRSGPAAEFRPGALEPAAETLRAELVEEIIAMTRYATSSGGTAPVEPATGEVIDALAKGGTPLSTSALLEAHRALKLLIAPATPAGIRVHCRIRNASGPFLGPHGTIRRLSLANLGFLLMFFGTSLSTQINAQTIHLSVFEQSGPPLLFKLLFIMAVAGIGASFAVLFEAWEDVRNCRFDPVTESSYWLQIGLGVVAGIILTEIVQTGAPAQGDTSIKEPLLALAGGFSAGLLHVVLSRIVKTIRNFFAPPETK